MSCAQSGPRSEVVQGYADWRFFQSRVLGPWAEKSLNAVFGFNFLFAHMVIAVVVFILCGMVMFYAGRAIGGRQSGWSAFLAFQTLFALMMARPWLYIWDYFILLAAAIFLLLVIKRAPVVVVPVADGRCVLQPRDLLLFH